jgi:hypothetical protein
MSLTSDHYVELLGDHRHRAHMEEKRNAYRLLVEKPEGKP